MNQRQNLPATLCRHRRFAAAQKNALAMVFLRPTVFYLIVYKNKIQKQNDQKTRWHSSRIR
jgi:hypothetical protein